MRFSRVALSLALALLIALPLVAGEGKKGGKKVEKKPPTPACDMVKKMTEGLNLSDEQSKKLEAIGKEFDPKILDARKKMDVLTPEQKKAQAAAAKEAKAAGKKGKEAAEAVNAAVKMTDEQKAKQADARKEAGAIEKGLREQVMSVLTQEQKDQIKAKAPKKGEKKEKKNK